MRRRLCELDGQLVLGALAAAVLAAIACADDAPPGRSAPERIVLIVVDTLRADLGTNFGVQSRTPNIDALARRGQTFSNVWSSYHNTTMSMASLFTGRTPSLETGEPTDALGWNGLNWGGMRRFGEPGGPRVSIPSSLPTLAEAMSDAGYWTAAIATNALLFRPLGFDRGFDRWVELGARDSVPPVREDALARSGDVANGAVRALLGERPSDRLFLYVHYMDVHDRRLTHLHYAQSAERADRFVGELLAVLSELSLLDGAVVILTSDHGEHILEQHFVEGGKAHFGNPSFEEVLRVPLVVAPPVFDDTDRFLRGDDVHRLVKQVARIEDDGPRDLEPGELFVSELYYQTYRKGRWKSFRSRHDGKMYLVDLEADPDEHRDAAADHPEILAAHRARMEALTDQLAARNVEPGELTAEEERRLRALGYLE